MKFVLRSKSFLMRQPFQRKQITFPASRQNRGRKSGLESSRNLDEDQENEHNSSQSTLNRRTTTIAQVRDYSKKLDCFEVFYIPKTDQPFWTEILFMLCEIDILSGFASPLFIVEPRWGRGRGFPTNWNSHSSIWKWQSAAFQPSSVAIPLAEDVLQLELVSDGGVERPGIVAVSVVRCGRRRICREISKPHQAGVNFTNILKVAFVRNCFAHLFSALNLGL
jgi:hypothetical protein